MLSKEEFVKIMERIKAITDADEELFDAFQKLSKDNYVMTNINSIHLVLELLEHIMHDSEDYPDIEYFIYDLDWGTRWTSGVLTYNGEDVRLDTVENLYDHLVKNYNK